MQPSQHGPLNRICWNICGHIQRIRGLLRIRAELERAGERIGAHDLMIAAIGVAHDAVLVTGDVDELSRVQGLRIEDWASARDRRR